MDSLKSGDHIGSEELDKSADGDDGNVTRGDDASMRGEFKSPFGEASLSAGFRNPPPNGNLERAYVVGICVLTGAIAVALLGFAGVAAWLILIVVFMFLAMAALVILKR